MPCRAPPMHVAFDPKTVFLSFSLRVLSNEVRSAPDKERKASPRSMDIFTFCAHLITVTQSALAPTSQRSRR